MELNFDELKKKRNFKQTTLGLSDMIGRQKIMINECIKYELNIYNRVKMYVFVSSTHSSNAFFFASFALVFTYEVWL